MKRRRCSIALRTASALCLLVVLECSINAQVASSAASEPPSPPLCKDGASPGVIQLTPDPNNANKLALARKHFYLSPSPFNLATSVNLKTAPSLRSYYKGIGASEQLIDWLEDNHCETIYCREVTEAEVKCESADQKRCVPEFSTAYRNALIKLNGNQELARKWITNYEPLSTAKFRAGFFEAKSGWVKSAIAAIEKGLGNDSRIRSTITDQDGIAFFYDLCPGTYYLSSIAPVEIGGDVVLWESIKPIKVEGPLNQYTKVQLAFPPGENTNSRKIFGKKIALN